MSTSAINTGTLIADLRAWLATHEQDSTVPLTDDVLGAPLLQSLIRTSALAVRNAHVDLTQTASVGLAGTADLLGTTGAGFDLRVGDEGGFVAASVRLTGAADHPITMSGILATVAGADVKLPPEVPDLGFIDLLFEMTSSTGAFTMDGICAVPWTLPLGGAGLPVATVQLHLERPAEGEPVQVRLTLDSGGALAVVDGFQIAGFALVFALQGDTWELGGTLDSDILDQPWRLTARLDVTPAQRVFTFSATAGLPVSVDFAGAGSLSFHSLTVTVARVLGADAASDGEASPGGVRLDQHDDYGWTVAADAELNLLDGAIVLAGILTVAGEPGSLSLVLRPGPDGRGDEVAIPLPGASSVMTHLGLDSLDVNRKVADGASTWTVSAEAAVWFSGLRGGLDTVLAGSRASELTGTLALITGSEAGVSFSVAPVLPIQPFRLPDLHVAELFDLDLSRARSAFEVGSLAVRWARGGGLDVEAEFGVGIPAELNEIFGAGHDVFAVYDPANPDTLQRLSLKASAGGGEGGGPSLTVRPLSSPLNALVLTPASPGSDERQAAVDLGEWGSFSFTVPSIAVSGDTLRAAGTLTQHGLALPLSPLKWMLTTLGLGGINRFLPDRLPLRDVRLYDDVHGLDVNGLVDLVTSSASSVSGLTRPDRGTLWDAIQPLAAAAARMPDRLKPYLNIHIPEELAFDVAVSAEGAFLGGISVASADDAEPPRTRTPLRMLLPGLSAAGPMLTGIELWNLHVGEILGGAALVVRADLNIDQFDLLPLAALLALPEGTPGMTDPRTLTRRLVANRVTVLVVPEGPVAFPVFFDDLAVEYRGVEGADLGAHLSLPQPQLDVTRALDAFKDAKAFLTDSDSELKEDDFGRAGLDLELTAGPAYLQLPPYLGGQTYGSRTATSRVSAADRLVDLLNGLKKLHLDRMLEALPHELLRSATSVTLGPLFVAGQEMVVAPDGAPRVLEVVLNGQAALSSLVSLGGGVTVRSVGATGIAVEYALSGQLASQLPPALGGGLSGGGPRLTLSGAVANLALPGQGVLQLADPGARVVMPGPTAVGSGFTVEWWMYPAELWSYNQYVSAGDQWGSFVFHTTQYGEVYCGTDVATRFTPADLPAGTVERNTWQHFAFTYTNGTARFYKNGVQIAEKTGMAPPAPWTGMRLGISEQGTQLVGRISELRMWNYCRPAEFLQANMHSRQGRETGLIACWPFDEDAGDTVFDRGPNGWNGTARNVSRASAVPGVVPPLAFPDAGPPKVADIRGAASLDLFGHEVFVGTATVNTDTRTATVEGVVNLFPASSKLTVQGSLRGTIARNTFDLNGDVAVDLFGWSLTETHLALSDRAVVMTARWLNLFSVGVSLVTAWDTPWLLGTASADFELDVPVASSAVRCRFSVVLKANIREPEGVDLGGSVTVSLNGSTLTTGTLSFPTIPSLSTLKSALYALARPVIPGL